MMGALTPVAAQKLSKICGRLGSDFEGERAAAALLATRALHAAGVTWEDVLLSPRAPSTPTATYSPPCGSTHAARAACALRQPEMLTEWELRFLNDIIRWRSLTSSQARTLSNIERKLSRERAA